MAIGAVAYLAAAILAWACVPTTPKAPRNAPGADRDND